MVDDVERCPGRDPESTIAGPPGSKEIIRGIRTGSSILFKSKSNRYCQGAGDGTVGTLEEASTEDVKSVRHRVREMQGMADIAKGIEALEAVAAVAANGRPSSCKGSPRPRHDCDSSAGSASPEDEVILPSDPPAYRRLSSRRGMAALNVAGSRRSRWAQVSSADTTSARSGNDADKTPVHVTPITSASPRVLVRISSENLSTASDHQADDQNRTEGFLNSSVYKSFQSAARSNGRSGRFATSEPDISSSSSNHASPEHLLRDHQDAAPGGVKRADREFHHTVDGSDDSLFDPERHEPEPIPRRLSLKATSPHARGFHAITFHESFTPTAAAAEAAAAESAGTTADGEEGLASGRGSLHGRMRARGWWTKVAESSSNSNKARNDAGNREGERDGRFRAAQTLVGIRVENAELRMESRRLEEALTSAKENAAASEARSKELARQAASRVRQAEAQRVCAEDAAKEAQAKAYSLAATVQVLKRQSGFGTGLHGQGEDTLTQRGVEAEVTAAYQSILQDMDMERAALQQQLAELQRENELLRSRAVGPRTRSFSGATDSRDTSPLPTPRSYGRPKARGMSNARDSFGSESSPRESGGPPRRHGQRGRPGARLEDVLGARTKLVQLEGVEALAGVDINHTVVPPPAEHSRSRTEQLAAAESSAESPPLPGLLRSLEESCLPWSREFALWHGRVSLVVAPGAGSTRDFSRETVHSVLLTDAALYVLQAPSAARRGITGKPGGESLCRIEQHKVGSLSLPLETRVLPNGDEVAVRSTAMVVRLKLQDSARGEPDVEDNEFKRLVKTSAGVQRGFLWLACESNEARGELVEHLCQWFQWRRGGRLASLPVTPGSPPKFPLEAAVAAAVCNSFSSDGAVTGPDVDEDEEDDESERNHSLLGEDEDQVLDVDQVVLKELLEELGQERSLNVTALLLVDKDSLTDSGRCWQRFC